MPDSKVSIAKQSSGSSLLSRLTEVAGDKPWSDPLIIVLVVGVTALLFLGWTRANKPESMAVALLVGGAALASGALLGFVFGIPRAVPETASTQVNSQWERLYQVNTNLEQISDWLTKIIVGIGLVELAKIPPKFMKLAEYVANAFTPSIPSSLAAVAVMYFAISGFLGTYLWTRLLLTLEFTRADRAARQSPAFYEGLIEAFLYQPAPDGFQAAIQNGEEFIRRFGQGNWRVWRSLASAYGQKYSYLKLQETPDEKELSRIRDQAFQAVQYALKINPGEREGLLALSDPTRTTPQEDDLSVFWPDEQFRNLLVNGPEHA
jgi:hypothetical protein